MCYSLSEFTRSKILKPMRIAMTLFTLSLLIVSALPATEMPASGQQAPAVSLPCQDGSTISLNDFHGKWVVLYFYPKDQTPG